MNKNYRKGRAKEYRLMNKLKKHCDIVFRSAGSHSIVDCAGIDLKQKKIYLFQCKPRNFSHTAKERVLRALGPLNDKFIVIADIY